MYGYKSKAEEQNDKLETLLAYHKELKEKLNKIRETEEITDDYIAHQKELLSNALLKLMDKHKFIVNNYAMENQPLSFVAFYPDEKRQVKITVENNDVLFILPGIIALLGFGMLFGWLLTFTPFPILTMNDVRTDFSDSIVLPYLFHLLNGWIYTLVVVAIGGLLYISVICPLKKQVAIMRYCKLPLTEEEMRTAIEKGLFSDVKSYFDYLEKQMCYGTNNYLYFSTSEIAGIINACWKVFDLKDTDYFALPICMESFSILNDYITGFENGVFCAERSLCNKSTEPKIPVVSSYWGVYGAAYTPKRLPKCTKNI